MPKQHAQVSLNKRNRGFIRKSIELSDICKQEVLVNFFDRSSGTLVTYQSHDHMGYKAFERLRKDSKVKVEKYQSDDYQLLGPKYITKKQKDKIKESQKEKMDSNLSQISDYSQSTC